MEKVLTANAEVLPWLAMKGFPRGLPTRFTVAASCTPVAAKGGLLEPNCGVGSAAVNRPAWEGTLRICCFGPLGEDSLTGCSQ